MKTILQISKIMMLILMISTVAEAQYTYQTAKRYPIGSTSNQLTDSNTVVQPGVQTGCVLTTMQPVWYLIGGCSSGVIDFSISADFYFGATNDTLGVVMYGPFSDTTDLVNKFINSNIDTCWLVPGIFGGPSPFIIHQFSYQRGEIYMMLLTSTKGLLRYKLSHFFGPPPMTWIEDTVYCSLCNSRISQLFQETCTVTYDSLSQKNKLVWEKDIYTPSENYVVYRQNIQGTYDTIIYQSVSQLSECLDLTSNPVAKSYSYQMGIQDSCGNLVNKSYYANTPHVPLTTVHLQTYPNGNNTANLTWNNPNNINSYYIFRTDPFGFTMVIDSIYSLQASVSYTDINASAGINNYYIGWFHNPPCTPSFVQSYDFIRSNPSSVVVAGINEVSDLSSAISIQPNPFNDFTKVDLHLLSNQNSKVVLRNVTGQTILQFDDVKTNELIINKNNLAQGLYFLEVTGDNFYARKKVVVQ